MAQSSIFGEVHDLNTLNASEFQALLIPGGFGVAKNLSNYAEKGDDFSINTLVEKALKVQTTKIYFLNK